MAKVLILGGTAEAVALAHSLANDKHLEVVSSLAGLTSEPQVPPGQVRRGGFGGGAGLRAYLEAENVACLVDATHPFASTISANAAEACKAVGVPRLVLGRSPWRKKRGDDWTVVADSDAAAAALVDRGRRVFLSSGRKGIEAFGALVQKWFLVRLIEPPEGRLPLPRYQLIVRRGPFDVEAETTLLRRHRIDVLVSKNSGGEATYPKIEAARALGLPVVMIDRPAPPPGKRLVDLKKAADWVRKQA